MSDIDEQNYQKEKRNRTDNTPLTVNVTNDQSKLLSDVSQTQPKSDKKKVIKYGIVIGSILIAVVLVIVLSVTLTKQGENHPHDDIPNPPSPPPIILPEVSPFAYQEFNNFAVVSQPSFTDFNVSTIIAIDNTQQVRKLEAAEEHLLGDPLDGRAYKPVNPNWIGQGENNKWASQVRFDFALIDNYQAQLNITNLDIPNEYEVPPTAFTRPVLSFEARFTQVGFQQSKAGEPYSFNFTNIYNGETLISTYKRKLHITEKFSEIGFVVPSRRIYGIGQRNSKFLLSNGTYTLWSKGRMEGMPEDNGEGGQNGPHIHPFLLCQTQHKDFFGIFFAASSAQTFEIIYYPGYPQTVVNYIQLGGKMEMYFMMRGSAQEIIARYHALIGYSMVPPYYALGFFQGSNAYTNLDQAIKVLENYRDNNMAIEGIILDNYYAGSNQVFTVDSNNFKNLVTFNDKLKSYNLHMILGLQGGISNSNYKYYNDLITNKCYLVSSLTQQPLIGQQNGTVIYPDFSCSSIDSFLTSSLQDLDDISHFEGLFLQGNQLYSTVSGEITGKSAKIEDMIRLSQQLNEDSSGTWNASYKINPDQSKITTYDIPFIPGYYWSGNLDNQTVSLNATHQGQISEFYMHNINGHMQIQKIFNTLNFSKSWYHSGFRPLIFSESTWAGSGKYSAIAINDMRRSWKNLRNTVAQVMSFSMYGVQNVASDVCGNLGPIDDEELCGRWAQLAAFLPMMRNYYNMSYWDFSTNTTKQSQPSEFYNFQEYQNQFMASSALNQRMQYNRYIYSQMYKVYREGGSLVYPLFFDYPEDDKAFEGVEDTYMLGDAIKVSPVLEKGVTETFKSYFPEGKWADLNKLNVSIESAGDYQDLHQSYAYTNIHLKAGKIIPFQQNTQQFKTTEEFLTQIPMTFIVHRDDSQYAEGFILVDDGMSSGTWDDIDYTFWKLRYASKSINFWVDYGDFAYSPPIGYSIADLDAIHILQAEDLANTNFACYLGLDLTPTNMTYSYNPYTKILTLKPVAGSSVHFKDIGFIKFGNSLQEPNFCDYNTAFTYDAYDVNRIDDQNLDIMIQSKQGTQHLEQLLVSVQLLDDYGTINLNITTLTDFQNNKEKFKVPYVTDFGYFKNKVTKKLSDFFDFTAAPFSYKIFSEDDTTKVLYQSDPHKLYFDQYLVFDSGIFSMNPLTNYPLMGMGERAGSLFYKNENGGIHSRYSFDQANPIDDGLPPGRNMYGVQPFYIYQAQTTDWVGVFDLNSYATDYILNFNDGTNTQITKIVIGGMIQKYFFVGKKPDDVITTYSGLVGKQTMPPLWSFGWQQCRFGWKTDEDWYSVLQNYESHDLPLDTMWADIDYMDDYKIFTISQSRYANLAKNVSDIRKNKNMTFVPIMDVGVAVRPNEGYFAYDQGIDTNIFIKQYDGKNPLTAGVWCGHAYFPDFWHPNATTYWHSSFDYLANNYGLEFDGIWIDMNEATNFCNGYCIPSERPVDSLRNKPYYVPGWRDLEDKALGVDGLHYNGWHEYDLHSTYSLVQVKATAEYLLKKNIRPYVLSRSNFPGLAEYGYHWMGDNWSTVEYMALSVDGMYHYQLFGLPFSGSDICGFNGDAAPDLCTRWHQLGSLYPFSRNHNQNATASQEPYRFNQLYQSDPPITYTDIMRSALRNRYSFIKYYYSHFYDLAEYGGSFFKPLFFEFVSDPLAYQNIQINSMLGESLKLSIQVTTLDEGTTDFYFPEGAWCQLYPYIADCFTSPSTGTTKNLRTHLTDYYIHIRESYLIPYQNATLNKVKTTKDLLSLNTDLILLPSSTNKQVSTRTSQNVNAAAIGYLYFDDGVSLIEHSSRFDLIFSLPAANRGKLVVNQMKSGYSRKNTPEEELGTIRILYASNCQLNAATKAEVETKQSQGTTVALSAPVYDAITDTLTIDVVQQSGSQRLNIYDIISIVIS